MNKITLYVKLSWNFNFLTGMKLGRARLTDSADDFLYSNGLEFL